MSIGIAGFFGFNKSLKERIVLDYGRFVGVNTISGGNVVWSNDGITWNQSITGIFRTYRAIDFSFDQGLYVAVGGSNVTNNIMTSTNSVTWTIRSKPDAVPLAGIKWCSAFGKWIANSDGSTGRLYQSTDGITWTTLYTVLDTDKSPTTRESIYEDDINGSPLYATVLTSKTVPGTIKTLWTTDGVNFTESDILPSDNYFSTAAGRSFQYHPIEKRFLIVNFLSTFGESWPQILPYSSNISSGWATQSFQPLSGGVQYFIGSAYGNGLFIIPGFSGGSQNRPVHYSSTGLPGSWTSSVFPFSFDYRFTDVTWAEGINTFVLSNQLNNRLYTSNDGIVWTQRTFNFGTGWEYMVWGQGVRTTGFRQGPDIT